MSERGRAVRTLHYLFWEDHRENLAWITFDRPNVGGGLRPRIFRPKISVSGETQTFQDTGLHQNPETDAEQSQGYGGKKPAADAVAMICYTQQRAGRLGRQ